MKRRTAQEKELADRSRLARAWRKWHAERLAAALAGVHGATIERLMAELKDLQSARTLVNLISSLDWSAVDADTRAIALHEIDRAICALRERAGKPPIDDPLPGAAPSAFQIIRSIIFNGAGPPSRFGEQRSGDVK